MPREFPFALEGKTGYFACAPTGPSSCQGLPAGTDSSNTFVELVYEGAPTSVAVTLTWSATTPATSEMYAYVFAARSCGDGCIESGDGMYSSFASGPSPVALAAADIKLGPGEALYLHVGTIDPTPPAPVPLFYSLEQAFTIDGAVTALVNATA